MYGPWIKCHGSKNDFYLIDERKYVSPWEESRRISTALHLCDRKHELGGADGVLFVSESSVADVKYRIINADGSEASMCGNGLRLVARYVCEAENKETIIVETMKANLTCQVRKELVKGVKTYGVEISPIRLDNEALPFIYEPSPFIEQPIQELSSSLLFSTIAVPNPHLLTFVEKEKMTKEEQTPISTYVNGENELFPDGVNVSFVHVGEANTLFVRTFERGVGYTNACGTAMSAAVYIATMTNKVKKNEVVTVYTDKGMVQCVAHTGEKEWVELIGNATFTHRGTMTFHAESCSVTVDQVEENDLLAYEQLEQKAGAFVASWVNQ